MTEDADRTKAEITRLRRYGVDGIEMAESRDKAKKRFLEAAESLDEGDKLVVCSLSMVCRGVEELLEVFLVWSRRRFALVSLDEAWLEECREVLFEGGGELLLDRIHRFVPALTAGRRGRKKDRIAEKGYVQGGRPKGSIKMTAEKLDLAVRMYCRGDFTVRDICDIVRCNERSMYRYLKLRGVGGMRRISGTSAAGHEEEVKKRAVPQN